MPADAADTLFIMDVVQHTVEMAVDEIGRIVVERQELRSASAAPEALEENRRRLVHAQARLSQLLIERHLRQQAA
jgi:hypothetical protein